MWDDIRTYITFEIDPQEKSSHLIRLQRFRTKKENK